MKYRRVIISRYGGPEVLKVVEDEIPEPQNGEVRVKIMVAGVAFADIMMRRGIYPLAPKTPFTPGYDMVGLVDKLGEGVLDFKPGQMVAALTIHGSYAEYICIDAEKLVTVPRGLDLAEACCLILNYVTAYQMLHRGAGVRSGERILIHGAAGGVGTALLQLGRLANLEMYGTASSGKHELVVSLGGIPIDHKVEDFVKRIDELTCDGVDVVFDHIGGIHLWKSFKTLGRGGRLVNYGIYSILSKGKIQVFFGFVLIAILNLVPDKKRVMFYAITATRYSRPELCMKDLTLLFNLLEEGKIKPIIAERIPLVEVDRAHHLLESALIKGKIILVCNP